MKKIFLQKSQSIQALEPSDLSAVTGGYYYYETIDKIDLTRREVKYLVRHGFSYDSKGWQDKFGKHLSNFALIAVLDAKGFRNQGMY